MAAPNSSAYLMETEKGKAMLVFEGYMFTLNRKTSTTRYWVCRNRGECKARVHTASIAVSVTKTTGSHTHAPDPLQLAVITAKRELMSKAVSTTDTSHQLLLDLSCDLHESVVANMPSISNLKRSIRKKRQVVNHPLPQPTCREELLIPEEYKVSCKGEAFLQYDSGCGDKSRILMFATDKNLSILKNCECWLVDGTFKVVPGIFFQLYTIHALYYETSVPLVYVLMPDKKQTTYIRMLEALTTKLEAYQPRVIITDFEKAAINAFQTIFPRSTLQGCLFHLAQCVFRRIQSEGLVERYKQDLEFSMQMKMLPALAFVPEEDVSDAFEELSDTLTTEGLVIANYFEDTYIGRRRRDGRATPQFSIPLWSAYFRVLENFPRTNNHVEAWHRGLLSNIDCAHPNIFKFMGAITKEQALTEYKVARLEAGQEAAPRSARYETLDRRIYRVVSRYNGADKVAYLKNLSHSFRF